MNIFFFFFLGISTTSLYLELFSYSTMMLYNYTYQYSLLSYMEYPVLIVQEYILVALVLQYKRMLNQNTIVYICGYFALMLLFAYQILPRFLIAMLVVSTTNALHFPFRMLNTYILVCFFFFSLLF